MSLASHRCCARLKILKQAWIFSARHTITLSGLCVHRKAINKDKHLSSGVLPSRQQSSMSRLPGTPPPSVYQVTQCTALQAAECYVMHHSPYARCPFGTHLYGIPRYPGCRFAFPWAMSLQPLQVLGRIPQALRCLEGTTLSNRGQRPRI